MAEKNIAQLELLFHTLTKQLRHIDHCILEIRMELSLCAKIEKELRKKVFSNIVPEKSSIIKEEPNVE